MLFSDTAYQALPPGTPVGGARPFAGSSASRGGRAGALPEPPRSPWTDAFSAGTRISTGLALALDVIRATARSATPRCCSSATSTTTPATSTRLTDVAIAYRRAGIPLHVVGLNAAPEDEQFIRRLVAGEGSFVEAPSAREPTAVRGRRRPTATLATAAVLLALALAAVPAADGAAALAERQ